MSEWSNIQIRTSEWSNIPALDCVIENYFQETPRTLIDEAYRNLSRFHFSFP